MSSLFALSHARVSSHPAGRAIARISASWSLRLLVATFMATSTILTGWAGISTQAFAANLLHIASVAHSVQHAQPLPSSMRSSPRSSVQGHSGNTVLHPQTRIHNSTTSTPFTYVTSGEHASSTYEKWSVNDHLRLEVDVCAGALVVHASDLHIQGTRIDLSIDRFYNPMIQYPTTLDTYWKLSVAPHVYLTINSNGSISYLDPSGINFLFNSNGSGGFTDPAGLNATLTKQSDGSYHLDFHRNQETYVFDSNGHLIADKDKNGKQITYNYTNGQMTSITDTQGRSTTFTYSSAGQLTTITDPTGRTVKYTYESHGLLSSSTDPLGQITTYAYTATPPLITDPSYVLTSITDPAKHVINIAYDYSANQITSLTDATGAVTSFSYNFNGTDATTNTVTDARGNKTTYNCDSNLHVTKVTDALGHTQSKTYTPNYDVATLQDSLTNTTQFTFDANNNIASASDATGAKDSFSYQDSSHPYFPTSSQDAQGNSLAYTYDSPGNLTSVKNVTSGGTGETTSYSYNTDGTLASMTDGNGNKTSYSYDSQGNLIKVTPPSPLGATTLHRDSLSRATSVTDGKGQTTSFTYDALDRITQVSYADGSTISYKRDAAGNVTSLTDNTGTTTFTYDAANRLLVKQLPGRTKLTMTYDAIGNLASFADQGGTVNYAYNAVNLVTTLTEPSKSNTTFSYDANNRRTGVNYPNGVTLSLTYDQGGHETGTTAKNGSGSTLSSYSYTYGGTSLRQSMTDSVLGQVNTYHYDSMNRLAEDATNQGATQVNDFKYSYDNAGNRTSQTINGTQTTYTYNTANQLTSTSQGTNYSYDADGNLTSISAGNVTLSYNAKDQSTSINNVSMSYTGPSQDQRVQAGNISYVNSPLGVSSQTDNSGTTYYTRDNQGNLVSERTPSGTYYYLFDGLGSIVGLTDSSGNLVGNERYQYDPYGNLLKSPVSSVLQSNIWRFASGQFDSGTGLTKFGTRYYDPSVGRWTQQDPVGGSLFDPRSSNRYVYASCDPTNVTDLSGRCPICLLLAAIGVGALVGALVGGVGEALAGGSLKDIAIAAGVGALAGAASTLAAVFAPGGVGLAGITGGFILNGAIQGLVGGGITAAGALLIRLFG